MALELQIKTGNAAQQIKLITENLNQLKSTLDSFPTSAKLNNTVKAMNNFQGVNPAAISSVRELARAVDGLSNARDLSRVASGLNAIARVNVGNVANNLRALVTQLAAIRVPAAFNRLTAELSKFGAAANRATTQARQLSAALKQIRPPSGLGNLGTSIRNVATQSQAAASATRGFGGALGSVRGIIAGFGVTLGGVGLARFTQQLSDTERKMSSFNAITNNMMRDAGGGAEAFKMLSSTAKEFGLPLRDLVDTYPKFAASARLSGQSAATTNQVFKDMSISLAAIGADSVKTQRVFKAMEQMFSKGSVTAEELKQQLGDAIPGAVNVFAKSMGIGTKELMKMMEAGEVGSNNIAKFAATLRTDMESAARAMANSWSGVANTLSTTWFELEAAMSKPFFEQVAPSVRALSDAITQFIASGHAEAVAAVMGKIASAVIDAGTAMVKFASGDVGGIISGFGGIAAAAVGLAAAFGGVARVVGIVASPFTNLIGLAGRAGLAISGFAAVLGPWGLALGAAAVAVGILATKMGMFGGNMTDAQQKAEQFYHTADKIDGEVDTLAESFYVAAHAADETGMSIDMLEAASANFGAEIRGIERDMSVLEEQFKNGAKTAQQYATEMEALKARLEKVKTEMEKVDQQAEKYKSSLDEVSGASAGAGGSAEKSASGFRKQASAMKEAKSAAELLDEALEELGDTARETESSVTSVQMTGGSSGGDYGSYGTSMAATSGPVGFEGSMWSGGGISHKRSPRQFKGLNPGLWKGAPSFAGGGLSDSTAIPAILHPNEAVVPLTGGGAIPIEGVGGGGQTQTAVSADTQYLVKLVELGIGSKTELGRIWQNQNAHMTIAKNAFTNIQTLLMNIQNLGTQMTGLLASAVAKMASGGGGGGGGSSGSYASGTLSSLTGGSRGSSDAQDIANAIYEFNKKQGELSKDLSDLYEFGQWFSYGTGTGTANAVLMNPGDRERESDLKAEMQQNLKDFNYMMSQNADVAKAAYKLLEQQTGMDYSKQIAALPSYGVGSPNASKDASGGFRAMLHPDEAVIPLPDGRSVPVTLPERLMEYMQKSQGQGTKMTQTSSGVTTTTNRTENRGSNSFNIVINVNANDAASFSRSQDQIMQELRMKLDKVGEKFGSNQRTEDPTRRPR